MNINEKNSYGSSSNNYGSVINSSGTFKKSMELPNNSTNNEENRNLLHKL